MTGTSPRVSGTFCALRSARHCIYSCLDVGDVPGHEGGQCRATSEYRVSHHAEASSVGRIRAAGRSAPRRPTAARVHHEDADCGDDLCSAFRCDQPARDRGWAEQPSDAALSFGSRSGPPFEPCDANAHRPSALFSDLFAILVKQAHRGLRRKLEGTTYLIDSTSVALNQHSERWARFSAEVCGAKVHVVYDPDADQPVYSAFSAANVNDITAAKAMPIEAGATYVFDLGYYDYAWWAKLDAAGCRIVTRLKRNTPLSDAEERYLPQDTDILSDR